MTIGGTINGLPPSTIVTISDSYNPSVPKLVSGNGNFTINYNYALMSNYYLNVVATAGVYCTVTKGQGGPLFSDVVDVVISCIDETQSFIIMGQNGLLKGSIRGLTSWNTLQIPSNLSINEAAYGVSGGNVLVGGNGAILYSANAYDWNQMWSGVSANLNSVAYINNLFIAVGENGFILSSTNGINWLVQVYDKTFNFKQIKSCGSTFYALAISNSKSFLLSSTDGTTWNTVFSNLDGIENSVTCSGNGNIILAGVDGFLYSTDGVTINTVPATGFTFNKVIYFQGVLYAVGTNGGSQNPGIIFTSLDNGITWNIESQTFPNQLLSISVNNSGTFIAVTNKQYFVSLNGNTWTSGNQIFSGINNIASAESS